MSFLKPDTEKDQKVLDEESRKRGNGFSNYWRPKPGENLIRILPAKSNEQGATYHLRAAKHFIRHADRIEMVVCSRETFGKRCPICEKYFELRKEKSKQADKYRPGTVGVFNIIDRMEEDPEVQIYEAPYTVWYRIIHTQAGHGRMSNVVDVIGENYKVEKPGRDVLIEFDPKAPPQQKYHVLFDAEEPLGTPEQIKKWEKQITVLTPENLYRETSFEEAEIKAFGSSEEREELRKLKQEQYQRNYDKEEEEEDEEEEDRVEEKEKVEEKEQEKEKKEEEPRKEKKEPEKKEEKPKEEKKSSSSLSADIREKIRKIREQNKK